MIELKNISKRFITPAGEFEALKDISLKIKDGQIFGIIGMSGAGKSTLVRTINMLEKPTSGQVIIDGVNLEALSEKKLREIRRSVTMIFQGFNLLMQRNCLKNVCFPLELQGIKKDKAEKKALELLELVGLKEKALAYPAQLSGGQQQRVAIARALATNPKVLLCDEATSALDPKTTYSILELIRRINRSLGITVIVITHQMNVIEGICSDVAILEGGKIVESGRVQDIFSCPKSSAAKKLVYPETQGLLKTAVENSEESENADGGRNGLGDVAASGSAGTGNGTGKKFLRLVFNGPEGATRPVVAELAVKTGIKANIVFASTKRICGLGSGSIILELNDADELARTLDFIEKIPDVKAQEVTDYVQ